VNRYDPKYPKSCTTCGVPEETAIHLLQCPERTQWRRTCLQALQQHFTKDNGKWDTSLEVQELLLEGIKAVMEGREPDTITHSQSVTHIAAAQQAIGWEQVFSGRLASAWQESHSNYLGTKANKKVNGQTWGTALAQLLLQQWHNLWIERNGDRHGTDKVTKAAAAKRQAVREVELLYDLTESINPNDQWILATPLEEMKQRRTYMLRAWISSYEPILRKSHPYETRLVTG